MNIEPSHLIYLSALAVYTVNRAIFQRRAVGQKKSVNNASGRERLLVSLVVAGKVLLPMLFVFTPWLNWANCRLPDASVWVGIPAMAVALWLFWRSHADLGKSWSVALELNENHRLITQGVYRLIRHPMYASFLLYGIGQALLLNNWLAGGWTLAAVVLLYVVRKPHEEKMMLEYFGDEYRAYMQRTGGVVPRLHARET